eukprot:SAG11_NODE_17677_length_511_cov_2.941748_1_plen_27_part_01
MLKYFLFKIYSSTGAKMLAQKRRGKWL